MLWPCFCDLHTHIDKSHTCERSRNIDGSLSGADRSTAADAAFWDEDDVFRRMDFSISCAYHHGTVALRTHLINMTPQQIELTWPMFQRLKDKWAGKVELQAVSLVVLSFFRDEAAACKLADIVKKYGGIMGAAVCCAENGGDASDDWTTCSKDRDVLLDRLFRLAKQRDLDLDFHTDENGNPGAKGLLYVAEKTIQHGYQGRVVCGHCCSLVLQPRSEQQRIIKAARQAGITVVSLPQINQWTQDRDHDACFTPRWRGVTAVHELRRAGVPVAIASDNIRDQFYAYGDLDMLDVFGQSCRICHLDRPYGEWPCSVTSVPAAAMGLPGHCSIRSGAPADCVVFRARNYSELLSRPQLDRVIIRNGRQVPAPLPTYEQLDEALEGDQELSKESSTRSLSSLDRAATVKDHPLHCLSSRLHRPLFQEQEKAAIPARRHARLFVSTRIMLLHPTFGAASTAAPPQEKAAEPDTLKRDAGNNNGRPRVADAAAPSSVEDLDVDSVLAKELSENGPRSTRRTKIICTIGPASCSESMLETLAVSGMNVARLNMCHGDHEWHTDVINRIRKLNQEKGFSVAIMLDTEGSEVHTSPVEQPIKAEVGQDYIFTIRQPENVGPNAIGVSYDAFVDDIQVGDLIVVDGGMVSLEVHSKAGPDVHTKVVDPGIILSRANLTFHRHGHIVRARNAMLPVLSAKDWKDIDFAIAQDVDFIAISFVKSADVINNLKSYVLSRAAKTIEIISKVESFDSVPNIQEIVEASDGVMVARGDLGAQIPLEDVPSVQKEVVVRCRQVGKPVIVASHLLQSMIEYPTPTRAEVADIADVVRQRADALMLSGESAAGGFPDKCINVLRVVSMQVEEWCRQDKHGQILLPQIAKAPDGRVSEVLCNSAATMANQLGAAAIFAYTRRGYMANFLSRARPDCPIFAFTDKQEVRTRMNLRWGVMPFRLDFDADPERNVERTFQLLKRRGLVHAGDLVVVVSDLRPSGDGPVRTAQIRHVP
ncbi:hypothetical protein WJX73_001862 [Symbiochloris irregularis]|uniref:Pyruvate kinase n=1 Tax=Symbiochloris irregularis TaxID=706552 RepID=A0AAW1PD12_9CHLO